MEDIIKIKNILNFMNVKIIHKDDYASIGKRTKNRIGDLCYSFKQEMEDNYWESDYLIIVMIGSLLLGTAVLTKKTEYDPDLDSEFEFMYLDYLCGKPGFGAGSLALTETEKLASSLGMRYVELSSLVEKEEYYMKRGYLPFTDSCSKNLELRHHPRHMTKCLIEAEKVLTTSRFSSNLTDEYSSDEYSIVTDVLADIDTKLHNIKEVSGIEHILQKTNMFSDRELKSIIDISDYFVDVRLSDKLSAGTILGCAILKVLDKDNDGNTESLHHKTIEEIQMLSESTHITEKHGLFIVLMCGNMPQAIGSIILELIYNKFENLQYIHTECSLDQVSSYIKLGFRFAETGTGRDFEKRNDGLVHMMKYLRRPTKRARDS